MTKYQVNLVTTLVPGLLILSEIPQHEQTIISSVIYGDSAVYHYLHVSWAVLYQKKIVGPRKAKSSWLK